MATPESPATRTALLIGAPVDHSRSPAMHDAAFRARAIDARFEAMHVEAHELHAFMGQLRASANILGACVTVPHKQRILEHCDRLAPPAERIGAVNCLCFEDSESGRRVVGHNTDAAGFVDSVIHDAARDPTAQRVVLLGAGGAARAVHAGLEASGARILAVLARSPEACTWTRAHPWTRETLEGTCPECDMLVDCTSAGLSAESEAHIPAAIPMRALPDHALVISLVYHRQTALERAARERGLATLDGAGMLVRQGAHAFELWTGEHAPIDIMWSAAFPATCHGRGRALDPARDPS